MGRWSLCVIFVVACGGGGHPAPVEPQRPTPPAPQRAMPDPGPPPAPEEELSPTIEQLDRWTAEVDADGERTSSYERAVQDAAIPEDLQSVRESIESLTRQLDTLSTTLQQAHGTAIKEGRDRVERLQRDLKEIEDRLAIVRTAAINRQADFDRADAVRRLEELRREQAAQKKRMRAKQ